MSHADEARRIVDAMKTCQTHHPEMWLEPIAAALAAAERAGIEMAVAALLRVPVAETDSVWMVHGRAILCVHRLLPAAVAEPADEDVLEMRSGTMVLPRAEPAAKSLQDEIGAWGDVTFPNSTQQTIIAHLRSEVNEEIAPDCDPEELADAATLVMQLAHKRKLNLDALVRAKFEKNKRRKWAWDEKAGFSRHVKEAEPAAKCATCGGSNEVIEREEQVRNESGVFEWFVHRGPCPSCGGTR